MSAERGVRAGTNAAGTFLASEIVDSTAAVSQRRGEYHTTTEAVRGYACTARIPATLSTASSMATARTRSDRSHGACTRIRPAASDRTVNSDTASVFVVVFGFGDRGRGSLLADTLARLRHHIGNRQSRPFRALLGLPRAPQPQFGG